MKNLILLFVLCFFIISTSAQTVNPLLPNGDFETGNLTSWVVSGINGGQALLTTEGTTFSSFVTTCLVLDETYAVNIRSSGQAPTSSVGILTSLPFVAELGISFLALGEFAIEVPPIPSTPQNAFDFRVRLLDLSGNILYETRIIPNVLLTSHTTCATGQFSLHTIDTTAFAGQTVRLQFRQHTNVAGRGYFTLVDNVRIITIVDQTDQLVQYNNGSYNTTDTPWNSTTLNFYKQSADVASSGNSSNVFCVSCNECKSQEALSMQAGDPIFLNSLEFTSSAVDLQIAGRGIDYSFERHYRSRLSFKGILGNNWDTPYNIRVVPHPTNQNQVLLYTGEGRGDIYFVSAAGVFTPPEFHFRKMIHETDNSLSLRQANGLIYNFLPLNGSPTAGKLAAIITSCGNRLTFQYNDLGQMVTVFDSLSRPIIHEHDGQGRLSKIRDFINREVVYTYDNNGDLVSVRSPIVVGTPNGNDFPSGKTWVYTYSSGFTDEKLNHNLISITYPNEVAANGPACVSNFYDADDRMISQQWGGTNASGLAAGGTVSYAREEINVGVQPTNLELPREKVTVIDRNGNETVFEFNIGKNLIRKEQKTRGIRTTDPASFITTYRYNSVGLKIEEILPLGNSIVYEYDEHNPDQFQRGNLLAITHFPDPNRSSDQPWHKITYKYEPLFNQVIAITEQRGNDPTYIPQNGGLGGPARYTTEFIPDYFEGTLDTVGCACGHTSRQLVNKFSINITSILPRLNQGDINGDGQYSICGNVVLIKAPRVNLRPGSNQATLEGGTVQTIEKRISYSKYSQFTRVETPEGEVTEFAYYSERDPDGDGQNIQTGNNNVGQPFDVVTGGYLRKIIADNSHTTRYRGTVLPQQISTEFFYDRVGNTTSILDER